MNLSRDEARALLPILENAIDTLKTWIDDGKDQEDTSMRNMLGKPKLEMLELIANKARKFLGKPSLNEEE